ncbi:YIP1 family protein [Paraglaciecola aquimarina]|uniref:YIP1 family protein n=1 Tax=Paraglaciecola aquimarina TaxID=1235557 RepID=A0ABU3T060_9ALTE|nr:YIP1 family protein [Paraglaciecola aquimarina]MDU0355625.1 YIP1 family protein [Paraglaciecola aquimarina]
MELVQNPIQAMKDVFIKPNQVFATIAQTHNWSWLPFIFISVLSTLPMYFYFNFVDFNWYRELMISTSAGDLSPAELDMMRQTMQQPQILLVSIIGVLLSTVLSNAVLAMYLNIATKSDEECVQGFTDWYGFTWWVSMPSIVTSIIAVLIVTFASDTQLSPVNLAPTSLAFILGVPMDSSWASLTQAIRIESIWVMYLIAVGLSQWTQLSLRKTYLIATCPFLLIWAVWFLVLSF